MGRMGRDHVRHHRQRQVVLGENDQLLKRAEKKIDYTPYKNDAKSGAKILATGLALALSSVTAYVVMILMWFYVYYKSFEGTAAMFLILIGLGVVGCLVSWKAVMGRDRPWLLVFSVLFIQAACVGLIVGFFIYFGNLVYYFRYNDMRTYTNVAGSQSAYGFADGGMFLWSEDTRVDSMRAVGYKSRWTGKTYCAAPVIDSSMYYNANNISFWVVGVDCCHSRAEFHCDDAADLSVRSALVILEPEDIVRPYMRWAVARAAYPKFEAAIKLEQATYNTSSQKDGVRLVRWSKDPIALKDSFFDDAKNACIITSVVYFFLLAFVSCFLAHRFVLPNPIKHRAQHEAAV